MKKASKAEAGYVPNARTKLCRTCKHFVNGACTEVIGQVNPNGSCQEYYDPKEKR